MATRTLNVTEPLLGTTVECDGTDVRALADDAAYIDFDPAADDGDDDNDPMNWSPAFKWGIVALLAATAFTV